MTRRAVLLSLGAALVTRPRASAEPHDWVGSGLLREETTADPALRFFLVALGQGGSLLLTLDRDVPLARWLGSHTGQRVAVSFASGDPIAR